jgi:hypothetical protein
MVVLVAVALVAAVVTVVKTMPHRQPTEPFTLDELGLMMPDAAQIEVVAAMVRARIAAAATQQRSASAAVAACVAPNPPHRWSKTQRGNATTIVQVGLALDVPRRGLVIALATAMQESKLHNLGHLGARNDHDSLGLFQQRPSMGWGSKAQVTDPIYSATAFYLALRRVPGWHSMKITVAAQRVQRSAFPNAYAKWENDAKALTEQILCNEAANMAASSA